MESAIDSPKMIWMSQPPPISIKMLQLQDYHYLMRVKRNAMINRIMDSLLISSVMRMENMPSQEFQMTASQRMIAILESTLNMKQVSINIKYASNFMSYFRLHHQIFQQSLENFPRFVYSIRCWPSSCWYILNFLWIKVPICYFIHCRFLRWSNC